MDHYYITVYVTLQQEDAIIKLFRDNNWTFRKNVQEAESSYPRGNNKYAGGSPTEGRTISHTSATVSAPYNCHNVDGNALSDERNPDTHSADKILTSNHIYNPHNAGVKSELNDLNTVTRQSDCEKSKKSSRRTFQRNPRNLTLPKPTNNMPGKSADKPEIKALEPVHCGDCDYTFKLRRNYEKHKAEDRCRQVCSYCDKVFLHDKLHQYKLHTQRHLDVRNSRCSECDRAFFYATALEVHTRQHSGYRPFVCEACGATFPCINSLHRHKREEHSVTKPNFQCRTCGSCFKNKRNLKHHIQFVHEKPSERHFQCSSCGKTFKNEKSLIAHSRIHNTTKDFQCDTCSATFVRVKYLREHERRRHTNNFTHFCTWCDKGFYDTSALKRHIRKHTGHKPHNCPICPYRASVKASIQRHMKRHKQQ